MAAAGRVALKCVEVCGYCCQVIACGVEAIRTVWEIVTKICTCGQGWKGLFFNILSLFNSEEDPDDKDFEIPVAGDDRKVTDVPGLMAFLAVIVGMCFLMNRGLTFGRPGVYSTGVDSWTNICGSEVNENFTNLINSGINTESYPRMLLGEFITNPSDISFDRNPMEYTYLCVRICPPMSENFSCFEYFNDHSPYDPSLIFQVCGSESLRSTPQFNDRSGRCIPSGDFENLPVYIQNNLLNLYRNSWVSELLHDCRVAAKELTWLVLISFGFTLIYMAVVHTAASGLCWYSFSSFFFVGISVTSYLWYLYNIIKESDVITDEGMFPQNNLLAVNPPGFSNTFYNFTVVTTIAVIVLNLISFLTGMRNVNASSALFEAGIECTVGLKWVYILPITSILSTVFALSLWTYTLTFVSSIFMEEPDVEFSENGIEKGTYVLDSVYVDRVLVFHFFGITWVINFIIGCQSLIVCLAAGTYYFTIRKQDLEQPMRVATSRLTRNHLGSAAAGAFLVGFFGMLRAPFSFTQSRVITSTARAIKKEEEYEEQKEVAQNPAVSEGPKRYFPQQTPPRNRRNVKNPPVSRGVRKYNPNSYEDYLNSLIADRSYDDDDPVFAAHQSSLDLEFDNEKESKKTIFKGPNPHVGVQVWSGVNKICFPFFWVLNTVLVYVSDANYALVALQSLWFMQGGIWIRDRVTQDQRLKSVIAISSYALFLQKLTVTLVTLPFGFLLLRNKEGIYSFFYPLAVSSICSFIIAHIFFSLFEASIVIAFGCYLCDTHSNDGSSEAPFFGSRQFFTNFNDALDELDESDVKTFVGTHHEDLIDDADLLDLTEGDEDLDVEKTLPIKRIKNRVKDPYVGPREEPRREFKNKQRVKDPNVGPEEEPERESKEDRFSVVVEQPRISKTRPKQPDSNNFLADVKKNFKKLPGGTSVHIANESDDDESEEDIDDVFDLAQEEIEEQLKRRKQKKKAKRREGRIKNKDGKDRNKAAVSNKADKSKRTAKSISPDKKTQSTKDKIDKEPYPKKKPKKPGVTKDKPERPPPPKKEPAKVTDTKEKPDRPPPPKKKQTKTTGTKDKPDRPPPPKKEPAKPTDTKDKPDRPPPPKKKGEKPTDTEDKTDKPLTPKKEPAKPTNTKDKPDRPPPPKNKPAKPTDTKDKPKKTSPPKKEPAKSSETKDKPDRPPPPKKKPKKQTDTKDEPDKPLTPKKEPTKPSDTKDKPDRPPPPNKEPAKPSETKDKPDRPLPPKKEPAKPTETKDKPDRPPPPKKEPAKPTETKDKPDRPSPPKKEPAKPSETKDKPGRPSPPKKEPAKPSETKDKPDRPPPPKKEPAKPSDTKDKPDRPPPPKKEPAKPSETKDKPDRPPPPKKKPAKPAETKDKPDRPSPPKKKPKKATDTKEEPDKPLSPKKKPAKSTDAKEKPARPPPPKKKPDKPTDTKDKTRAVKKKAKGAPETKEKLDKAPSPKKKPSPKNKTPRAPSTKKKAVKSSTAKQKSKKSPSSKKKPRKKASKKSPKSKKKIPKVRKGIISRKNYNKSKPLEFLNNRHSRTLRKKELHEVREE